MVERLQQDIIKKLLIFPYYKNKLFIDTIAVYMK